MEAIKKFQDQILAQAFFLKADNEYHNNIKDAFIKTHRHLFINKFKDAPDSSWTTVTPENLASLLPLLYAERPLIIYQEPNEEFKSTISQPHIVLQMLEYLQLQKGNTVFEVGAASGWNAALMGALVGEEGHVYSAEIIPELAMQAKENIEKQQISNVTILNRDAGVGYEEKAPFDRIIFTAGSFDLPHCFYDQLKDDGILLMVHGLPGGGDQLLQLKKVDGHFEAIQSLGVDFIKWTGKYQNTLLEPVIQEELPEWSFLKDQEVSRIPYWWGGMSRLPFYYRTFAFRSFLSITEPGVRYFKEKYAIAGTGYFGILNSKKDSLTIAREKELITYGNDESKTIFMNSLHEWIDFGMPAAAHFKLKIYPSGKKITPAERQWVIERKDSTFVWSL